jgi:hypothetical protein
VNLAKVLSFISILKPIDDFPTGCINKSGILMGCFVFRNSFGMGRISTVDFLVLTSLYQLLLILQTFDF